MRRSPRPSAPTPRDAALRSARAASPAFPANSYAPARGRARRRPRLPGELVRRGGGALLGGRAPAGELAQPRRRLRADPRRDALVRRDPPQRAAGLVRVTVRHPQAGAVQGELGGCLRVHRRERIGLALQPRRRGRRVPARREQAGPPARPPPPPGPPTRGGPGERPPAPPP